MEDEITRRSAIVGGEDVVPVFQWLLSELPIQRYGPYMRPNEHDLQLTIQSTRSQWSIQWTDSREVDYDDILGVIYWTENTS